MITDLEVLIPPYAGRPVRDCPPCRKISPFDAAELPAHLEAAKTAITANAPNYPGAQKRIQDAVQVLKDDTHKAVEKAVEASLLGRLVLRCTALSIKQQAPPFIVCSTSTRTSGVC